MLLFASMTMGGSIPPQILENLKRETIKRNFHYF
jgi:hypothetical protein